MSTANIHHREVVANKSPRNAFDMSHSTLFSSPAGLLQPVFKMELLQGDRLKIGLSNITRTRPLNTSAFMTFDEKIDFWAVPIRLLWSDWKSWRLRQTYRHRTTELSDVGKQYLHPYCRYADISDSLGSMTFAKTTNNPQLDFFTPRMCFALRMLDHLMYGIPKLTGLDMISMYKDPNSLTSSIVSYYNGLSPMTPVNYFRLAAYQCIYMHGYRNEEYEKLDPSYYNVDNLFANLTYNNTPTTRPSDTSTPSFLYPSDTEDGKLNLFKLFTPRYKNLRKDIFTSAKPSTGFDMGVSGLEFPDVEFETGSNFDWDTNGQISSTGGIPYGIPNQTIFNSETGINEKQGTERQQARNFNPAGKNAYSTVFQRLFTQQSGDRTFVDIFPQHVRTMMSQDKFVRSAIYADKSLDAQMKAIFGFGDHDPHKPRYLGSYSSNISISDVVATGDGMSDSSSSVLGQIAGKGYNGDGKDSVVNFTADDDCIVLGIHYVVPRNNYDSYRIDKMNTKVSPWDYPYPMFDGLGMQPVYMFERNIDKGNLSTYPQKLFGFAPRYYEYKQRVNEVHGSFMEYGSDYDWTLSNNSNIVNDASDLCNFKVLPSVTDRIFAVAFDGSPATDPFQHYYSFKVTKVSNMEIYGTPSI